MAFNYLNFQKWSQGNADGLVNNQWAYYSTDAIATIVTNGYFDSVNNIFDGVSNSDMIRVNDLIYINCLDYQGYILVSDLEPTIVSSQFQITVGAGAVGTSNLANDAVTTVKIDDDAVTTDKVAEGMIQHLTVIASDADVQGMYVTPIELVPAPGAGKKIHPIRATYNVDYGGVVFANGGAIHIQYDDTTLGAGPKATGTQSAASLIGATADTTFGLTPVDTTLVDSTTLNQPLCLSNATGAFTGGTGSELIIDVWYAIADYT